MSGFVCCFCNEPLSLDSAGAGILTLRIPAYDAEAAQDMYCHGKCLQSRLTPHFLTLFEDAAEKNE